MLLALLTNCYKVPTVTPKPFKLYFQEAFQFLLSPFASVAYWRFNISSRPRLRHLSRKENLLYEAVSVCDMVNLKRWIFPGVDLSSFLATLD